MLPIASYEQQTIINNLEDYNIIIDSVAGSGKTTTNLHIAKYYSNLKILLLTYNTKLRAETNQKAQNNNISNIVVHTYHSFGVKYYSNKCMRDNGLIEVYTSNIKPYKKFNFDLIILDEAQDISNILYNFICKIVKDNNKNTNICILGDRYQSIYQFNNADERYIIFADKIFNFNDKPWKKLKLSTSFRITHEMSDFINNCLLKEERMFSTKSFSLKPRYIICNTFSSNDIYDEILYYIDGQNYSFEDIFILAPSVKSMNCPARRLANQLSHNNIPIYVPMSDDGKIDETIIANKIVFSTYHQAKGLERKVVIIFGFDESYFKFFKKDYNQYICPNEIYVALTRASEQMTIIHHHENNFLPFLPNYDILKKYCNIIGKTNIYIGKQHMKPNNATDLVKHLSTTAMNEIMTFFDVKEINKKSHKIDIPIKTQQNDLFESVSDITGIAIPSWCEYKINGRMQIHDFIYQKSIVNINCLRDKINYESYLTPKYISLNDMKVNNLLYISNIYNAIRTGYIYKTKQITVYDWLTEDKLNVLCERVGERVSNNCIFECPLKNDLVIGVIDCYDIDKNNLWEFKCVEMLSSEHMIQLAIYMYLFYDYYHQIINSLNNEINDLNNNRVNICHSENDIVDIYYHSSNDDLINDYIYIDNCIITKIYKNKSMIVKLPNGKSKKINDSMIKTNHTFNINNSNINLINNYKKELTDINKKITECKFYLFNILDEQIYELSSNYERLVEMINLIIKMKSSNDIKITDEQFIDMRKKMFDKYFLNINNLNDIKIDNLNDTKINDCEYDFIDD